MFDGFLASRKNVIEKSDNIDQGASCYLHTCALLSNNVLLAKCMLRFIGQLNFPLVRYF